MTHVLAAHALRRGTELAQGRVFEPRLAALFYVGTCLPDLLGRAPAFVFSGYWGQLAVSRLHDPVFSLLVAYALALFAPGAPCVRGFFFLCAGVLLHYLLDWMQAPLDFHGEDWLLPLPWRVPHLGLFWPDATPLALPWLLAGLVVLETAFWTRIRRGS